MTGYHLSLDSQGSGNKTHDYTVYISCSIEYLITHENQPFLHGPRQLFSRDAINPSLGAINECVELRTSVDCCFIDLKGACLNPVFPPSQPYR